MVNKKNLKGFKEGIRFILDYDHEFDILGVNYDKWMEERKK